jgi:prepilin-type N-terminal cleavage/methylation domain-containing protein
MSHLRNDVGSCLGLEEQSRRGFTLLELLVVTAIIGILASLLLPVLAKAKLKAQGIHCLNNTRQLTLGWLMYADDHDGWLCPNGNGPGQGWVEGTMSFDGDSPDNTNTLNLVNAPFAKLGPYIRSAAAYHCPADRSTIRMGRKSYSRVRSLAMNDMVGTYVSYSALPNSFRWRLYRKMSDVIAPSPAGLWLLIEQHPDSIDDGRFAVDCESRDSAARLVDFPSNFHDRAASLSFADGHGEVHQWRDARTLAPNRYCGCLAHYSSKGLYENAPNSVDVAWLQARTSAVRN